MPGKKPTATAAPGKRGQRGAPPAAAGFEESIPAGVLVGEAELVEVADVDDDVDLPVELVDLLMTQRFPLQV
jgi:hypothetical protein